MNSRVIASLLLLALHSQASWALIGPKPSVSNGVSSTSSSSTQLKADNVKEYRRGLSTTNDHSGNPAKEKTINVVMKFGGSSLADGERIDHVANLIKNQIKAGYRPRAVVCSAMGKSTNNLLTAGEDALEGSVCIDAIRTLHTTTMDQFDYPQETRDAVDGLLDECEQMLNGVRLIQELSPKSLDQLVSYGERCSVRIMAARLTQLGVPAQAFDAWDVGIATDSRFGDASLLPGYEQKVQSAFDRIDHGVVAVVTGFIGQDPTGKITTLGRGGSDLTATAIGSSLSGMDEIQVWKDVDGILSSDPRLVPNAVPVSQVSYDEASELAYFGAQVLHPIAMQPAMKHNVPVRVKNSYNPSHEGTIIKNEKVKDRLVTAITYKRNVNVLDIESTQMLGAYGFLARVFTEFERHKLSVDVLASSEVSVSLTLDKKQDFADMQKLMTALQTVATVTRKENMSILTLIADVEKSSHVLATVFRVFSTQNIKVEMMSQGASKVNISFIVADSQLDEGILSLHKCFFEDSCSVEPYAYEKEKKKVEEVALYEIEKKKEEEVTL